MSTSPVLPPLPPAGARALDVVSLGEASIDLVATIDGYPAPDTKVAVESLVTRPGGQIATAVRALARLGWRAAYLGPVGDDAPTGLVLRALGEDGVDLTRLVRRSGTASRTAILLVDRAGGTRTVLGHRDPALNLSADEVPPEVIGAARILLLDATDPPAAVRAAGVARQAGTRVVLDLDEAVEHPALLAPLADVVMASEGLAARLGDGDPRRGLGALARLSRADAAVIVTLGSRGAVASRCGHLVTQPAFRVPVVDTTGAGDVFHAGFIHAWLETPADAPLDRALVVAAAAAGLACGGAGAQGALPRRAEVDRLLSSGQVMP